MFTHWQMPPQSLTLAQPDVHIWRIALVNSTSVDSLNAAEQQRAQRLSVPAQQRRFITARSSLRMILARYLNVPPLSINFMYSRRGKPSLPSLAFNLSHTADWALCAVSYAHPLGIDIEQTKASTHILRLAQRFFSTQDYQSLLALPAAVQSQAFYQLWVTKEAYAKALDMPLIQALKMTQDQHCHLFMPMPDYVAAVITSSVPVFSFYDYDASC